MKSEFDTALESRDSKEKQFDTFINEMVRVFLTKSNDYASPDDFLSNFKMTAKLSNLTPEKVCYIELAKKITRLGNLLDGKEIKHESLHDNLVDLANYCAILDMILKNKSI